MENAMTSPIFATIPRMQAVWSVLEAAKDNGDEIVIAACRRLIVADRLGWKKHAAAADKALAFSLAESTTRSPHRPAGAPVRRSGLGAVAGPGWPRAAASGPPPLPHTQ